MANINKEEYWPSEEEIRKHAYELYLTRRSDPNGDPVEDWLTAEAQLKAAGLRAMQRGKSEI
jgi:hypothetical protein